MGYTAKPNKGNGMTKSMSQKVGEQIRKLRLERKLTLDKLAEEAGLSKSYLWELENKSPPRPSAEKLDGIAKALGVTVDYFMGADTPEELEAAEDKAFFREYQQMSPAMRKKLRDMKKLLDE
jgi:transcriptional regulator with XRE-family HTH domain